MDHDDLTLRLLHLLNLTHNFNNNFIVSYFISFFEFIFSMDYLLCHATVLTIMQPPNRNFINIVLLHLPPN